MATTVKPHLAEYTITELSDKAKTTVRNVRAYQEKGILAAPEKRGRSGIYNEAHLERLRVINQLLDRGYSIANIAELIEAQENGLDLHHLLGLRSAVTHVFDVQSENYASLNDLMQQFNPIPSAEDIQYAIRLGLIEVLKDGSVRLPNPGTVRIGIALTHMNLRLNKLLYVVELMQKNFAHVTKVVAEMFFAVLEQQIDMNQPDAGEKIIELIQKFQPLFVAGLENEMFALFSVSLSDRMTEHMLNNLLKAKQKMRE